MLQSLHSGLKHQRRENAVEVLVVLAFLSDLA